MSRFQFEFASRGRRCGPAARSSRRRRCRAGSRSAFAASRAWFAAAVVDGRFRQVVACRDLTTGRIFGFGSRSVRRRYINGRPEPVGYLSSLRILPEYRNRGLLARGYAFFRQAHTDGRCRFYLTTVATGNKPAQEVLTSGRAGLPSYLPAGDYCTLALPRLRRIASTGLEVRPAADADLPRVLAFLAENGPRRQFFPCYAAEDFQEPGGSLRGLGASNILLAERSGRVVGTLAGWDQHGFRQSVIEGYGGWLRWARPWYNLLSRLHGRPQLPALGHSFHYLTAALPVIRDDSPHTFAPLLHALCSTEGNWSHVLLGLHETDPLLPIARRLAAASYTTHLYLVGWDDMAGILSSLDERPLYLELGGL